MFKKQQYCLSLILLVLPLSSLADGIAIDRIENPYVQPLEHEIAYQLLSIDDGAEIDGTDGIRRHQFEYGHAISDRWLLEFELVAAKQSDQSFGVEAYEVAAKYQLTEQGEFNNDWAVQFEIEKLDAHDVWDVGLTLIGLREMGRFVATANLGLEVEFGQDIEDEVESHFAGQFKYRYAAAFEPAFELFKNQSGTYLGPSGLGQIKFSGNRKLFWELGWLVGVTDEASDRVLRLSLEYEFY